MNFLELIRLTLVIAAVFLIPGWAFLSLTRFWQKWDTLQRWCVAMGLSISFYPVLFYATRSLFPFLHIGPNKNLFLLIAFLVIAIWGFRRNLFDQIKFDPLEWLVIGIWCAIIYTRLMFAWQNPYPAWSDSLHHTLLTQLTAVRGQLPYTLEPYEPTWLGMYHLGLYSLTGLVQQLGKVPAHTALLWTSQVLNSLCGVGVFFALDKNVGRKGALVGTIVVGLLSFQPAWYANWGRFTQISSQAILLIAWVVTWEVISAWRRWDWSKREIIFGILTAACLNAAVFLLHFRVAGFYLPLLAITCIWELVDAAKPQSFTRTLAGLLIVGLVTILFTAPALIEALSQYIMSRMAAVDTSVTREVTENAYYSFSFDSLFVIGLQRWLFYWASISLAIGLFYRNKIVWMVTLWVSILWAEGEAYRLNIPWLSFTNMGAILIMLYIPAGLLIGTTIEELLRRFSLLRREKVQVGLLAIIFFMGYIASYDRITGVEAYRQFITPGDVPAMEWIKTNTPKSAIFAINTHFWLPKFPHGTDGGYWIPYFTDRRTTAGTMLTSLGPKEYFQQTLSMSQAAEQLAVSPQEGVKELCRLGVRYIYIGPRGDFSGTALNASQLSVIPGLQLSLAENGVSIFNIVECPE